MNGIIIIFNICYNITCRIRKFPGQTESTLSAEVELISTIAEKKSWTRPPIQMEFQVIIILSLAELIAKKSSKGIHLLTLILSNILNF